MRDFILVNGIRVGKAFKAEKFGRLTTEGPAFRLNKKYRQVCLCDCGIVIVAYVNHLGCGHVQSCGCLRMEITGDLNKTHGRTDTKEYRAWRNMQERCYNPNNTQYKDWGGRGIYVCDRWLEPDGQGFLNFLADMGECPRELSLNRKDNDGPYCKDNCEWATKKEQASNTRRNHYLTWNEETRTVAYWTAFTGIHEQTILSRIRMGWSVDKALGTPPRGIKNRPKP